MENKIIDINDLVLFLSTIGMKPLLDDGIWQCYGYKKRPKHGSIWNRIFPKLFELEDFISKEIIIMGLIDVLNGIKKSAEDYDAKLLISLGVIDQFLSVTKDMDIFLPDSFMETLLSSYATYLKTEKSEIHIPVILRAKGILDKKDFVRFAVGTFKLFAVRHTDDFLLKSDSIKDIIEESSKENKLKISVPHEMYKKYVPLIKEKILNNH
jgi:hypothetical protein